MVSRNLAILVLLPALLLLSPGLVHADAWPVARGPSREPDPYRYDPKHVQQAPKAFLEDATACIVFYRTTYRVEPDGTVETTTHEVTRLNGRKGISSLGEYRGITFDPAYQKLTLNEARVIKPNGSVVAIEPRHVQLRDVGTDYEVYEAEKELVISFPNLQVGDLYEVKWTTRGKHPENAGHFFLRYNFGSTSYPTLRDELQVILPKDKKLQYASVNRPVQPTIREAKGERSYVWSLSNEPLLPKDNDLPPREELRIQVMCSTFPSWEAVGQWKQKLRADCWTCTPEVRKVVEAVTRGLKTPVEKARALTYWVRRNIRYVSVVSSSHRYTPSTPAVVVGNLFGDCKDQAQLLAVLLREAGLDVRQVTLGIRGDGQIVPAVPSPWGTHAILLVSIDGKDHWIDTTSTLGAWDYLPRNDCDRMAYVTDVKGNIRLLRTPERTWADNRTEHTTLVTVLPDGTSRCSRISRYYGSAAVVRRDDWLDTPPGECRRLMAAELQDANSQSKLLRLDLVRSNLHDLDEPVCAILRYDIPGNFTGTGEREAGFTDSKTWNGLLAYNLDYERQAPLDLNSPFDSTHRYVIDLPPAYRFSTGTIKRTIRSPWGFFQVMALRSLDNPRRLVLEFHTRLEKSRVNPADFDRFRQFHQEVFKKWRLWVNIMPATDRADAPALEKVVARSPEDRFSAKVLARLYLQNGRPEDARRVVELAKPLALDDSELWELAVQAAPTLAQEETLYRQMRKRFPKRLDFAVSLGATCVERSKYAEAEAILEPLTNTTNRPLRGQIYFQLARCALQRHRPAEAVKHLEAARQAAPEDFDTVQVWEFFGQAHEQLGQPTKAVAAYRRAWKILPDARGVLAALVRLELKAKHARPALEWLRRYTLAVKGDLEGLNQAALFHLRLGRLDDALDLALQARDMEFHADTQKVLGLIYLHKRDYVRTAFHLDRANRDAEVLLGLIQAHLALGELTQAADCARGAAVVDNPTAELNALLKKTVRLLQRKLAILAVVKDSPQTTAPAQAADLVVCAEQAFESGRSSAEVEALLKKSLATGVALAPVHSLRGLLALQQGQLRAALADAERALQLDAGEARAYLVRGRVRLERGDKRASADLERAALLANFRDADVLEWLAAAQWDEGHRWRALQSFWLAVQVRMRHSPCLPQIAGS
jgi:tetratricopeptide (TPR) repeat protein